MSLLWFKALKLLYIIYNFILSMEGNTPNTWQSVLHQHLKAVAAYIGVFYFLNNKIWSTMVANFPTGTELELFNVVKPLMQRLTERETLKLCLRSTKAKAGWWGWVLCGGVVPGIINAAGFAYIHTTWWTCRTWRTAGVTVPLSWKEENKKGGESAIS